MKRQFPALRGLAILLVILNHTITLGYWDTLKWGYPPLEKWGTILITAFGQLGWIAVPTFLFISGGFFAYAAQGNPPRLTYKVVLANLLHILWPYLIWSIIFYILLFLGHGEKFSLFGYVKNLIVGYPFNFVPLIVFYYLLSPILVLLMNRFGWVPVITIIAGYQIFLINIVNSGILGLSFPEWMNIFVPPVLSRTMADWGVYFPLGLIYSLKIKNISPWLEKYKWVFAVFTLIFYILSVIKTVSNIGFPFVEFIFPLAFVLFSTSINRNSIPMVRELEYVGKRAYGLYLTDLIVIDTSLLIIRAFLPWMIMYQIILQPLLFSLALTIPLSLMNGIESLPKRSVYRYVFG
jgi:hypothetical protein